MINLNFHLSLLFFLFYVYTQLLLNLNWLAWLMSFPQRLLLLVKNILNLGNSPIIELKPKGAPHLIVLNIFDFFGLVIQ